MSRKMFLALRGLKHVCTKNCLSTYPESGVFVQSLLARKVQTLHDKSEILATIRAKPPQPQPARVLGEKVWCPRCGEYVKVVRVSHAAKIVDVDRRTVYNYLKRDKVFAVKVAGSTLRICSHCLLREK